MSGNIQCKDKYLNKNDEHIYYLAYSTVGTKLKTLTYLLK